DRLRQPFDLARTGKARRERAIASRRFHQKHVGLHILEARGLQDSLIVETNVPGVKESLSLAAHHEASGAESMAGIIKLQSRRGKTGVRPGERGPVNLPIILEALKQRLDLVHLIMTEQRIILDAGFVALPLHHVYRIVQHSLDQEVAQ